MNIILAFSGIWGTQYGLPVSILKSWLPDLHDLVKGGKRKRQITMLSWPKNSSENANYTSLHLILQSEKLFQNVPTEMKSSKWPAKEKTIEQEKREKRREEEEERKRRRGEERKWKVEVEPPVTLKPMNYHEILLSVYSTDILT